MATIGDGDGGLSKLPDLNLSLVDDAELAVGDTASGIDNSVAAKGNSK